MKIKYFSQIWEQDTDGTEHLLAPNQVALTTDLSYGRNPAKIQHRVLAIPVTDNNPMSVLAADGSTVKIPDTHTSMTLAAIALFEKEISKRLPINFGWYTQGLHCTNTLCPSELARFDRYSGFKKAGALYVRDVVSIMRAGAVNYDCAEEFLPHIMVEVYDDDDAGNDMYDIVERRMVRVIDTYRMATFRMRNVLGDHGCELVADVLLRHMIAQNYIASSKKNPTYEQAYDKAATAKVYVGYQYDTREPLKQEPVKAASAVRELARRTVVLDPGTYPLSALYDSQAEWLKIFHHDVRYGSVDVKMY